MRVHMTDMQGRWDVVVEGVTQQYMSSLLLRPAANKGACQREGWPAGNFGSNC